jgi:hypothetical protein
LYAEIYYRTAAAKKGTMPGEFVELYIFSTYGI